MKRTLNRITRMIRRSHYEEVAGPTPIVEELSATGVVNAMTHGGQPASIDLAEMVKARIYARHGYLAYINTFK